MKKLIAILLTAAMILTLAACAKTDPDLIVQKGENGQWDITGTWKMIDKYPNQSFKVSEKSRYYFYPDGTYYSSGTGETVHYKVSGNIVVEDGGNSFGLTVEGDTMTWKKGNSYIVFKRISLDTTVGD